MHENFGLVSLKASFFDLPGENNISESTYLRVNGFKLPPLLETVLT